eukprot:15363536-Ditylum_brightwellii.AAC.1
MEVKPDGDIITVTHIGPWGLVDDNYLKWPSTMPPFELKTSMKERQWSQQLESMRKDVECTFCVIKDGSNKAWERGVKQSEYLRELQLFDIEDVSKLQ